jgi:hypothetical protein
MPSNDPMNHNISRRGFLRSASLLALGGLFFNPVQAVLATPASSGSARPSRSPSTP